MPDYQKLRHAFGELAREHAQRERSAAELARAAAEARASGNLTAAIAAYEALLRKNERNAEVWCALGLAYAEQGRLKDSAQAYLKSLALDPWVPAAHLGWGAAVRDLGDASCAEYLALMGVPASHAAGVAAGLADAVEACRARCAASPQGELHATLGHLALAQQRVDHAREAYEAAHALAPSFETARALSEVLRLQGHVAGAQRVLGRALYAREDYAAAAVELEAALASGGLEPADRVLLARALWESGSSAAAERVCREAAALQPTRDVYRTWVRLLIDLNRRDQAMALAERAASELSDPLFLLNERCLALPVIYDDVASLHAARAGFVAGVERFLRTVERAWPAAVQRARELASLPYYHAYQAHDDVALQARLGTVIQRLMCAAHPAWGSPRAIERAGPGTRIRVGYLSSDLHWHSVGRLIHGWIAGHDRTRFEVFTYLVAPQLDSLSRQTARASEHFVQVPHDLTAIAQRVTADDLHILVYPAIGMDDLFTQLASLHLAPIQCAAWGHPVTTGLPSIDYFLSNEAMESAQAERHYSETLVRLPGIGVDVPRPYLPDASRDRAALGLPHDAVLYLSPQAMSKYLPQHDDVFPRIAAGVPNAVFVFFDSGIPEVTACHRARMTRAFARAGLDAERHILYLQPRGYEAYLELTRACDLFLDTLGWSGGISTLDALGCCLPVITCPGELLRERQSFGMLRRMGIGETIGASVDELVELAVQVGTDVERRARLRAEIGARQGRLFGDTACVRGLEAFFVRVAGRS